VQMDSEKIVLGQENLVLGVDPRCARVAFQHDIRNLRYVRIPYHKAHCSRSQLSFVGNSLVTLRSLHAPAQQLDLWDLRNTSAPVMCLERNISGFAMVCVVM
jgi:hypothetical protein